MSTPPSWHTTPYSLITTPKFSSQAPHDAFTLAATDMALVHNAIIRGLNSIYHQTPHIHTLSTSDKALFIKYCRLWYSFLHRHHTGEEQIFFPKIEAATGVKDIMEPNVHQHHEFLPPLEAFKDYLDSIVSTPDSFDAEKVISLIEAFAPSLTQHLHDEIPTLLSLRQYGSKVDIVRFSDEEGEHAMKSMSMTEEVCWFLANLDLTYEGGIHAKFPPAPAVIKLFLRWVAWRKNADCWRFGSVDVNGAPKELFVGREEKLKMKA